MKVGSKLLAVLAAPVAVLLILGVIGINQRRATASGAQRVEQLAQMAAVNADLAHQLQREAVYSAGYMASAGTQWKAELRLQRRATNAAVATYRSTLDKVHPQSESSDLQKDAGAVNDAISNLPTQRNSVDGLETPAPTAIGQFDAASQDLTKFNSHLAQAASDPSLSRGLTTFADLNGFKESTADEAALAVSLVQVGQFPKTWPASGQGAVPCDVVSTADCEVFADLTLASGDAGNAYNVFVDSATPDQKALVRNAVGTPASNAMGGIETQIFNTVQFAYPTGGAKSPLNASNSVPTRASGPNLAPWSPRVAIDQNGNYTPINKTLAVTSAINQLGAIKASEDTVIGEVVHQAQSERSKAQQEATLFFVGAVGASALALIIAFYVSRSLTVPLKKLTSAAYSLSTEKLPGLVERLRNPDESATDLSEALAPIDINTKDEIGQLADAFNSIQHVTIEVAEEQGALLRKGIGDIFINLARRNQTLLDRQIEFIDQLEANEEDPDQLDNLFKLDHLATRMRRNAESLLVLAGAEPPRRRGRPVALADVVRVAIGEVEDFARISLLALDDVTVGGNVAVDLAHLLSELMENATHFSPPDTTVEIVGHRSDDGYTLSVSDQGIGMSADQLAEANTQLARPPLVGLALSRSLGFIVIGRLAARFAIQVKLTSSPSGGVTALVTLPADLVTVDGQPMAAPVVEETTTALPPPPPSAEARVDEVVVVDEHVALDDVVVGPTHEEPEVVVVDEATDAAVAADGAAGRELELEEFDQTLHQSEFEAETLAHRGAAPADEADLLDDLIEEPASYLDAVPEGDEFERGLQSLVSDELAPGPVEGAPGQLPTEPVSGLSEADSVPGAFGGPAVLEEPPVAPAEAAPVAVDEAPVATTVEAKGSDAELTAAGLVKRTPKKKADDAAGGGMPVMAARASSASQRSPEEVRKMLSRYRSGLNKGRGGADGSSTDTTEA
ncbi:MAG TPA: nitrate- and nitrite sensing domain-containing protein [Acidimicrobiales bacterium]|nr:nitrate- and nitrite sensing domain-containing protein [Acidimicrobiales bacterium]